MSYWIVRPIGPEDHAVAHFCAKTDTILFKCGLRIPHRHRYAYRTMDPPLGEDGMPMERICVVCLGLTKSCGECSE